jgi:hypothetical protein
MHVYACKTGMERHCVLATQFSYASQRHKCSSPNFDTSAMSRWLIPKNLRYVEQRMDSSAGASSEHLLALLSVLHAAIP